MLIERASLEALRDLIADAKLTLETLKTRNKKVMAGEERDCARIRSRKPELDTQPAAGTS